jgi:hypothetical protein
MELNVNINPEQINKMVADAVLESATMKRRKQLNLESFCKLMLTQV